MSTDLQVPYVTSILTVDGGSNGIVTVASTTGFRKGARVLLKSKTIDAVELVVDEIISSTKMSLRDPTKIGAFRFDCSAYLATRWFLDYKDMTVDLDYKNQTGNFTVGQVVTGTISGATGTIINDTDGGATGTLTLQPSNNIAFEADEALTDPLGGAAEADGTQTSVGLFTPGQIVTDGGAGAGTATILAAVIATPSTGTLELILITPSFVDGEAITDPVTGDAVCDGTVYTTGDAAVTQNEQADFYARNWVWF